jgi:hypothetical protein
MPPTTEEMKRWFQKAEEVKLNGGRDVHVSPTQKRVHVQIRDQTLHWQCLIASLDLCFDLARRTQA